MSRMRLTRKIEAVELGIWNLGFNYYDEKARENVKYYFGFVSPPKCTYVYKGIFV